MTTLIFEGKTLQVIAEDTAKATEFAVPYEDGRDKEDVDKCKKTPCLTLVKDRGIYLMTGNNKSSLKKDSQGSFPASYAKGYDPREDWGDDLDRCRRAVGGSDFAMQLTLAPKWIKTLAENPCQLKLDVIKLEHGVKIPKVQLVVCSI